MRILITGVTGQIGSALLKALQPYGTLVPAGRSELDLTTPDNVAQGLSALKPDVIVNPAAYTAVDRAEDEQDLAFTVNARSAGAIGRWAAERSIPLVHFSTDYAFDGSGSRPWREDDPTGPLNVYGASKLAGEQEIRDAGGPHLIVRTSWIYAAAGTNFLRTITRLAAERDELRVVADQFGAPTSAASVASAVARIFARDRADLPGCFKRAKSLVNVAAAGETTWHGFATEIVAGLRQRGRSLKVRSIIPIRSDEYPVKARRPHNSRLDMTRLIQTLHIQPEEWRVLLGRELDQLLSAEPGATPLVRP